MSIKKSQTTCGTTGRAIDRTTVGPKVDLETEWRSAICYNAQSVAKILRELLDALEFKFTREKSQKHFTKLMMILPMPRFAYVFRFIVSSPSKFVINTYDIQPTSSGELHFIEVQGITNDNLADVQKVLDSLASALPRKPWDFFWSERFRYALLASEYRKAKKAWNKMGVT